MTFYEYLPWGTTDVKIVCNVRSVDSLTPTCRATADGRFPSLNNRAHSALLSGVMIRGLLGAAGRKKDHGPALRLCPTQFINVRCGMFSGALPIPPP